VRFWRAFQICCAIALTALALSGCMTLPPPVAVVGAGAPPSVRGDLDALAYGGPVVTGSVTPVAPGNDPAYRLDAGDRLRIVVYGQEGLTNSYAVDAGGSITMPLIGAVRARGLTPAELAQAITVKLRGGYIREPYVAAEVEAYRPFFILGEVAAPGQYPYVPNMTVESAVAIAGGFSPRAQKGSVDLTRTDRNGPVRATVPLGTLLRPGDTIVVSERWF
jgi:polysaccharide export outer membrane protein